MWNGRNTSKSQVSRCQPSQSCKQTLLNLDSSGLLCWHFVIVPHSVLCEYSHTPKSLVVTVLKYSESPFYLSLWLSRLSLSPSLKGCDLEAIWINNLGVRPTSSIWLPSIVSWRHCMKAFEKASEWKKHGVWAFPALVGGKCLESCNSGPQDMCREECLSRDWFLPSLLTNGPVLAWTHLSYKDIVKSTKGQYTHQYSWVFQPVP